MADRGEVISKFANIVNYLCPYISDEMIQICEDALALLKAQTAQWIWDRPHHFRCSGCNGVVGQRTYLYCPNCGREMGLEERERKKEWPD